MLTILLTILLFCSIHQKITNWKTLPIVHKTIIIITTSITYYLQWCILFSFGEPHPLIQLLLLPPPYWLGSAILRCWNDCYKISSQLYKYYRNYDNLMAIHLASMSGPNIGRMFLRKHSNSNRNKNNGIFGTKENNMQNHNNNNSNKNMI